MSRAARKPAAPSQHQGPARPFATYYFTGRHTPGQWSRIGRAATQNGAIRAALRHLLEGSALSAIVHGEGGEVITRLIRDGQIIRIVGVI